MRSYEFIDEGKATSATCRKGREGKKIGISARSSCVSQGLMRRETDHTTGEGKQGVKGSGRRMKGKFVKGVKYGGPARDYS